MKAYFHTFGCKANQYDTEAVRQALEMQGVEQVLDPALADVAVVNSCTVTQSGERKMRGLVRRLDRKRPGIRTVVMGCAAAVDDGTIAALPGVAKVVEGADTAGVVRAFGLDETRIDPVLRSFTGGARAWVKIQDGCDEHCTFCATTIARGANRSRSTMEIVEEAHALSETHEELVLTGVHIGTYGLDRGDTTLSALVRTLVASVPKVRFRLSSVEATEVDDPLIELMQSHPDRIAPHLHAPLQSGSDRVLKRMGRHWYTSSSYAARCHLIADRLPVFGLGADVIVGFPGETAADHIATRDLISDLPFTYLHVFPYSPRPGSAAPRLGSPVHGQEVSARTAELRELAAEKLLQYKRERRGSADLVTLGRTRGQFRGLTEDYLDVYYSSHEQAPARFSGHVTWDESGNAVVSPVEVTA